MPFGRDSVALVIGGYGAVVSTAVFTWTVYLHRKDASSIRVTAKILTHLPPASGDSGKSETFELDEFFPNDVRNQKPWVIEIHYANEGQRPATIVGWAAVRQSPLDYPPAQTFHRPVTLQESETAHFFIHNFDIFRQNTTGFVLKDSHGRSWPLPQKQLAQIQQLMLDHSL